MVEQRVYDVSLLIEPGMPTWPGNPPLRVEPVKRIGEKGSSSNVSLLHIGTHTGTHVDAPRHFIPGASGVDSIPTDVLLGPARLFQLPEAHHIDAALLATLDLAGITRLLLGTRNADAVRRGDLPMDYAFVSADAAAFLADAGIRLIGLDYLSIEEYQKEGRPTHNTLLGAGIVIIEGLDLAAVPAGDYELICMPLRLKDADGAPARVMLREI